MKTEGRPSIFNNNSPGPRAPCSDDHIIDADRSTLRLSTGYPIDLSRRSSKNEDGNLSKKKSSPSHTGELCPNLPKC